MTHTFTAIVHRENNLYVAECLNCPVFFLRPESLVGWGLTPRVLLHSSLGLRH